MKLLQEGPLADFLNRFMDLILLNALWLLCSLPVFTLGASVCALYHVTMRYVRHEDPPVVRTFFQEFQMYFQKATVLFLIVFGAGLFLGIDLWCAFCWQTPFRFLILVVILAAVYFYLAVVSYVFPVLVYFDIGVRESVRKAFVLSMSNGIFTVFIMILNVLPVILMLLLPGFFGQILFLYLVGGFAVISFLCSLHLVRIFEQVRGKEEG